MPHDQPSHLHVPVHDLDGRWAGHDAVVVEEPLEVRVSGPSGKGAPLAVTMRTPGDDLSLAVGMCWSEGVLTSSTDLLDVAWCRSDDPVTDPGTAAARRDDNDRNVVTVRLRRPPALDHLARHGVMTSACGVCGRMVLDDLDDRLPAPPASTGHVDQHVLRELPQRLRGAQAVFGATGGLHAVARFGFDGELLDVCEDVGRHNAFDKLVGRAVRRGVTSFDDQVVLLSGRASYELLAKAAMVRAPIVAAIGAPSSLAVEVADRAGITLVGFLRNGRGNVHSHVQRIGSSRTAIEVQR